MIKMNSFRIATLLLIVLLTGCISSRYTLNTTSKDKNFLKERINELHSQHKISKTPLIVIDGVPYRYNVELKKSQIKLDVDSIYNISVLNQENAIKVYDKAAIHGVLIITTKKGNKASTPTPKILYQIDGRDATEEEIKNIDPKTIESIEVIKEKSKMKSITKQSYDGAILIHLKKF